MPNPSMLDQNRSVAPDSQPNQEPDESFGDILKQYEHLTRIEPKKAAKDWKAR